VRRRYWPRPSRAYRENGRSRAIAGDPERLLEEASYLRRVRVARRIGQAYAVDAGIEQGLQQPKHFGRIDVALDRAAESGADAAFDHRRAAGRIARDADVRDSGDDFVRRPAQVGKAMRMAGRQRDDHQVRAGLERALGAFRVRHQHPGEQAGQRLRVGEHLCRVSQLRQPLRRHERADLDLALARRMGIAHPFTLARGRNDRGDALPAVAQTDLANHDLARQGRHLGMLQRWTGTKRRL